MQRNMTIKFKLDGGTLPGDGTVPSCNREAIRMLEIILKKLKQGTWMIPTIVDETLYGPTGSKAGSMKVKLCKKQERIREAGPWTENWIR